MASETVKEKNMKRNILLASLLALAAPAFAAKKLKVVATVPDLVDMTKRIGGDLVDVQGMARGTEDIHQVTMRPSFVTKLNKADAVVMLGLTVEHSYLPGLLEVADNPNIQTDPKGCRGPGCIDCSVGVRILEVPETLSRQEGELHPLGNPHYNIGPQNGPIMAKNIAAGLSRIDPEHADEYKKNLEAYLKEIDAKIAEWKKWVEPLKGMKAVSYHKDVAYLGEFTGLDFVDTVELKPGVAPTPTHLVKLVNKMKAEKVPLLVREQHFDPKIPDELAQDTGAKVAVIGVMTNSLPGADTWVKQMETNLRNILTAAGKGPS
jgi:zinc/manganese transport system substrate-binding protein